MKRMFAALLCAVSFPVAASAADLDYSYLEGGFSENHLTGVDSGSGYTAAGSLGLPLGFFLDARLDHASFDTHVYLGTASMRRTTAHVGWHIGVMDSVELVLRLGPTHLQSTSTGQPYLLTAHGYDANAGIRAQLPAGFEVEADFGSDGAPFVYAPQTDEFATYVGPDQSTETYQTLAVRYHLTDDLLLGLSYSNRVTHPFGYRMDSTLRTWLLAARWDF